MRFYIEQLVESIVHVVDSPYLVSDKDLDKIVSTVAYDDNILDKIDGILVEYIKELLENYRKGDIHDLESLKFEDAKSFVGNPVYIEKNDEHYEIIFYNSKGRQIYRTSVDNHTEQTLGLGFGRLDLEVHMYDDNEVTIEIPDMAVIFNKYK